MASQYRNKKHPQHTLLKRLAFVYYFWSKHRAALVTQHCTSVAHSKVLKHHERFNPERKECTGSFPVSASNACIPLHFLPPQEPPFLIVPFLIHVAQRKSTVWYEYNESIKHTLRKEKALSDMNTMSQSNKRSTKQATNPQTDLPTNQPAHQPPDQPIHQSINKQTNKHTSHMLPFKINTAIKKKVQ